MILTQYGSLFEIFSILILVLPIILFRIIGKDISKILICITIIVLYLFMGPNIRYLIYFLLFEILLLYTFFKFRNKIKSDIFYFIILVLSLGPIIYSKLNIYMDWKNIEFIGMSYIEFRILQIIIEIYDGNFKQFSVLKIFNFIVFFPCLSSGPIDRYKRFCDDLQFVYINRKIYIEQCLLIGLKKILYGIVFKFAIADLLFLLFMRNSGSDVLSVIQYMYVYTFYLFFDFAGYSYMAIGTGYLLGIKVPENFNKPFLARNMKEFWERWHISLSRWFGDFVFTRIVLNLIRYKIVRKQATAIRIGYMFTMGLMGMWHGFTVFYFIYGIYQGIALVLTDIYLKSSMYRRHLKFPYYNIVSRVVCFHIVALGLLIFSGKIINF